jgi:uncharacterized protein YegL
MISDGHPTLLFWKRKERRTWTARRTPAKGCRTAPADAPFRERGRGPASTLKSLSAQVGGVSTKQILNARAFFKLSSQAVAARSHLFPFGMSRQNRN